MTHTSTKWMNKWMKLTEIEAVAGQQACLIHCSLKRCTEIQQDRRQTPKESNTSVLGQGADELYG